MAIQLLRSYRRAATSAGGYPGATIDEANRLHCAYLAAFLPHEKQFAAVRQDQGLWKWFIMTATREPVPT